MPRAQVAALSESGMIEQNMRPQPSHDPSLPFRLTATDLLSDLAWPKLLQSPRLALRPGRIGIGVAIVLILSLLDQLFAQLAGGVTVVDTFFVAIAGSAGLAGERLASLDAGGALLGFFAGYGEALSQVWEEAPVRASVLLPMTVFVFAFGQVAIGRLSAEEFARGRFGSWTDGLRWGVHCVAGLAIAVTLPLIIAIVIIGILALGGWVLLSVPFVNVIGALLAVVGLVLGFAAALVLVGYALGVPLFGAAIAVEGRDGIDAMHRTYAYLLARPARYVGYAALLAVQGIIAVSILGALAVLATSIGTWAWSLLLSESGQLVSTGRSSEELGAGGRAAAKVMHAVLQLPALLVAGYAVAYWSSACTMLYLVLRRTVDGQDMVDLYVPGEIDAKLDEILDRRSEAIRQGEGQPE